MNFDYDLDEIVSNGGRHTSLRTAINEYIDARKKNGGAPVIARLNRDLGKKPDHFDQAHLEELTRLPEFKLA
jgi:hypothetical protein